MRKSQNKKSRQIFIPERGITDLTFEEELKAPLIFKGEYLKTIDKSWDKFKKKYLKRNGKI